MKLRLFLFFWIPAALFGQSEKAFDLYAEGLRSYYAANYDQALKKYNEAIQIKPTHTGFLYNRGLCYMKLGRPETAAFDFRKIVSIDSNYADAWFQLSVLAAGDKRYDEAMELVSHALRIAPNDVNALSQQGLLFYYQRRNEYAVQAYDHAISVEPNNDQLYYKRGLVYMNLENYEAATDNFSKAFQLDQTNTLALEQRATAYWKWNNLEAACKDWSELLKRGVSRAQTPLANYCNKK
ncbi:MAG: tetratricopeptide repeat protein [Chitinophagales bacterium]